MAVRFLDIAFFFAGMCVSHTLARSRRPVTTVLFWDLLGAAAGASLAPILLEAIGAYGAVGIASGLTEGRFCPFVDRHRGPNELVYLEGESATHPMSSESGLEDAVREAVTNMIVALR